MNRTTEFLDPARKLVEVVVNWLYGDGNHPGKVKNLDGARSLAHLMVVVPTAQSGRSLRLALAQEASRRGWGGVLPPKVVLPMQLVKSANGAQRIATEVELRAGFIKFVEEAVSNSTLGKYPHLFQTRRGNDDTYELAKDFRAQLAFFDQLMDIWRILAGGGLTMVDVPRHPQAAEKLANALGDEAVRWEELARLEEAFFGRLHELGLRHQVEDIKLARREPQPIPEEIEEVVLPMLADPVAALYDVLERQRDALKLTVLLHCAPEEADRFDDWGRPQLAAWTGAKDCALAGLRDADIVCTATDGELAKRIAADFPPVAAEARRPALGLCDAELFPELSAAFLNQGYVLNNPERHRLQVSSLGRMLGNLLELYAARKDRLPWTPFVALLREDDVLRALTDGEDKPRRAAVLAGIDICQNQFLPSVLAENLEYDAEMVHYRQRDDFAAFVSAGRELLDVLESAWGEAASPVTYLRRAMSGFFAQRSLAGTDAEKEFRAATDAVRGVLDAFDGEVLEKLNLGEGAILGLMRRALAEGAYSLEPQERNVVSTEGWLELVWSAADKIALAGFTEGAVPDSVVGHPFVPDELRVALGLTSNAGRLARDTMLLTDLVRSRAATPGAVRAYLAMTSAAGDQRRPSRLLFLVEPGTLAARVARLFGDMPAGAVREARKLEVAWRPQLPMAVTIPRGRLSASAIDTWLRCPFTYLLKCGLGMERVEEKCEFEASDFGHLIHGVLEDYANEQLQRSANGVNQLSQVDEIRAAFVRLLAARRAKFGDRLALKLRLQFDAAEGRLAAFAPLQAQWAAEGWRIAEKPEYSFEVRPFAGEDEVDMPFKGNIDRIDFKENVGYRLIDYKTWDNKKAKKHVVLGGEKQHELAVRLGLPEIVTEVKSTGEWKCSRFLTAQLLLYAQCLECHDAKFRGKIADCCYAILGKDAENVGVLGSSMPQGDFDAYSRPSDRIDLMANRALALNTVRTAIRRIRGNCFWPPGPTEEWKYDFQELFMISPERDLENTEWRQAQESKLEELGVAQ